MMKICCHLIKVLTTYSIYSRFSKLRIILIFCIYYHQDFSILLYYNVWPNLTHTTFKKALSKSHIG